MTAVGSRAGHVRPAVAGTGASRALTGLALRQVRRGALIVMVVVAGMAATVAVTYESAVGDALSPAALAALAENPAVRTLFGEPVALGDPGGFTVWRTGTALAVVVGVWGLLAATRITRGEEDAGRWDLLLAGRIRLATAVAGHLAVIIGALLLTGVATAAALVAAGTAAGGALLFAAAIALTGVFFAAAGALAAQVFPARAAATGATVALLGATLLARMVGDGVDALGWLRWLSPFGLLALARPYEANRVLPLVVLALAAAALVAAVPAAAARRDVRGGWLAPRTGRAARRALLGSVPAFAMRRLLRPLAGWTAGIGAYVLLIGLLTVSMTDFLAENAQFADMAGEAGFGAIGSVEGFAGTLFSLLAIPVGVFAAVRIAATAADEADRRLTLLYAQPLTRLRLLGAEVAATAAGALVLVVAAGLALWAGAVAVGAGLGLGAALAGALNVLPVVLLCLGAAVLALGRAPRVVALVGMLPAVGGFLLLVLADSTGAPEWVGELSPFAHLATVPEVGPDWTAAVVMVALALALGV
ncbi:MAG TPA: polyketide antibiotic transporter, partial [Pseudonocardia sp.]|nr:polyketide antibiotic transporter [Pseudonocardia sp.]